METIRKKINLDDYKCHRNAILPFYPFNEKSAEAVNVDAGIANGDFGQFSCDFVFFSVSATSTEGSVSITERETMRNRYLDLVRKYRFIQKRIKGGILVVVVDDNKVVVTSPSNCAPDVEIQSATTEEQWSSKTPEREKYDYEPCDKSLFIVNDNGYYSYTGEESLEGKTYLLLIDDYDKVMQYEEEWDSWWEAGFALVEHTYPTWEQQYLDVNYVAPQYFKFCQDFEKYVLGLVNVPQTILGSKVPEVVYYLNFKEYIDWFDYNREFLKSDIHLVDEWGKHGGDEFYDFLKTIEPKWITKSVIDWESITTDTAFTYFTYDKPCVDLDLLVVEDNEPEWLYAPYEYSVENVSGSVLSVKSAVTGTYVAPESGVGSALTPHFVSFEDSSVKVESRLETVYSPSAVYAGDSNFGIFDTFKDENDNNISQLFKCTYHTGFSRAPKADVFCSGYTYDYEVIDHYGEYGEYIPEYIPHKRLVRKVFKESFEAAGPYVTTNCYQVTNVKEISVSDEQIVEGNVVEEYDDDGFLVSELRYWSATTDIEYGWWECEKADFSDTMRCADGEDVLPYDARKYQNVMVLSNGQNIALSYMDGVFYYFAAIYDNGVVSDGTFQWQAGVTPITYTDTAKYFVLPFRVGEVLNVVSHPSEEGDVRTYDVVTGIEINDGFATVSYVLGAESGKTLDDTGIHYEENIGFATKRGFLLVDGANMTEVFYQEMDLDSLKETIYNEEFGLEREVKTANIVGMEVGTQWTNEGALILDLFTNEGLGQARDEIKYDISLEFDRGNGAAWESYFKLSECNSLSDLENYGNNDFNL